MILNGTIILRRQLLITMFTRMLDLIGMQIFHLKKEDFSARVGRVKCRYNMVAKDAKKKRKSKRRIEKQSRRKY